MLILSLLVCLFSLAPAHAFPVAPPLESLAGLTPGISTLSDAAQLYGGYDVVLPGNFSSYVSGERATRAYRWTNGLLGQLPGLVVETSYASQRIDLIAIDDYPGMATSRGLTALVPEQRVVELYGFPDYAYELKFADESILFHELFYIDRGLLVVLGQVNGRTNWTVSKLILTYPTSLRNAVSLRNRYAMNGQIVEDITDVYRVWARMAFAASRRA
ncbi:MAG TPA: hypothetical protein VGL77_08845 [Armatimonadota bacterium]|jgi:hypothetical protein